MTVSDWVMVLAVLAAPIMTLQIQRVLDDLTERRKRKLGIFQVLMTTRGYRLSTAHVEALNCIDLDFARPRTPWSWTIAPADRAVVDAWRVLHAQLCEKSEDKPAWNSKVQAAFVDLLHTMAASVGYTFDKVQLRNGHYAPQAHSDLEVDQLVIRKLVAEVLAGRRALPVITIPHNKHRLMAVSDNLQPIGNDDSASAMVTEHRN